MRKALGSVILFLFGWKVAYPVEYQFDKMLMIAAPHTSSWDTLFALSAYWKKGLKPKFLIHDKFTRGIFGYFFKKLGGIGVDRSKDNNLVDYSVKLFNESSKMLLVIAPEGTKYKTDKWKTGFFNIAKLAEVPLSLGLLDYNQKVAGIGALLNMSGDFDQDMNYIERFYQKANPKYPDRYNKKIF